MAKSILKKKQGMPCGGASFSPYRAQEGGSSDCGRASFRKEGGGVHAKGGSQQVPVAGGAFGGSSSAENAPYYLDFNLDVNAHRDRLGTNFQTYHCLDQNQNQINTDIQQKILDFTQKYRSCRSEQNQTYIKVEPAQVDQGRSHQEVPNGNDNGVSLSFWGINRSPPESVATMSPAFLRMKHQQELTQLQQNAHNYPELLEDVKMKQAKELQVRLEQRGGAQVGFKNEAEYTRVGSFDRSTTSLNAQGEWKAHNPSMYAQNNSKYEMFKKMSPEMLNKLYGKPGNEEIMPGGNNEIGDVFEQTSCKFIKLKEPNQTLKKELEMKYRQILSDKSQLKSFNQGRSHHNSDIPHGPLF